MDYKDTPDYKEKAKLNSSQRIINQYTSLADVSHIQ